MRWLVYDVATSLDGFISGPDDDVSGLLDQGDHVDAYFARLGTYDTVVMGRKTYEIGYAHGMAPGDKPYPHMDHYVLSKTLALPPESEVKVVAGDWLGLVDDLKSRPGGDIYLCGGGTLAGLLLAEGRIDRVILKLNPVLLGDGVRLFGGTGRPGALQLEAVTQHASGVATLEYSAPG